MTALPAYPVSKVGRSCLRVLLILLAVTIMQIRTNNSGLLGVNNSDRRQCQSVYCKILRNTGFLWTDFLASCRETNRFSVSKICPEPAKPTVSLALLKGICHPGRYMSSWEAYVILVGICHPGRHMSS